MNKLLICGFMIISLNSCAQVNYSFKQSYFFVQPASYGRELPVLEGKTPARRPDTLYFLYLETSKKGDVQISLVQYNGKLFQASVHPVAEKEVRVGKTESGEEIVIRNTGNNLVKVELEELSKSPQTSVQSSWMQVKGTINARAFKSVFKKKIILAPEIRG